MTNDHDDRMSEWVHLVLYFDTGDETNDELDSPETERRVAEIRLRHDAARRCRGLRRALAGRNTRRLARLMRTPVDPAPGGSTPQRRRRRAWWVGLGGLVAVVGAGSLAYALWPREQVSNPAGILCYEQPDLVDGDRAVVELTDDAITACAVLWTDGTFSTDGPPPLTGCVNEAGIATVLPGEAGLCAELGLPDLEPGLSRDTEAVVALNDRIIDEVNAQPCAPADQVLAAAEQILAESGLDGWTATIGSGWEDADCAKVAVDAPTRTLTVFGV